MTRPAVRAMLSTGLLLLGVVVVGCSGSPPANLSGSGSQENQDSDKQQFSAESTGTGEESSEENSKRTFQKVKLGTTLHLGNREQSTDDTAEKKIGEERADEIVQAMQPLQVVLGNWQGITNKTFEGFKSVAEVNWIWDFQTDKTQPTLVMTSEQSPYVCKGRLTYLPAEKVFRLTTDEKNGDQREYRGTFTVEPSDVPGDNKTLQRTFKLQLRQPSGESDKEVWQIVLNQQENNRYLMELSRSRNGGDFHRFDTVGTQRQGTSFAISDTDYKDKTCIISEGLGTIQVSHKSNSYWVCCTGCKAAFEEEPDHWIAKLKEREKEKTNQ